MSINLLRTPLVWLDCANSASSLWACAAWTSAATAGGVALAWTAPDAARRDALWGLTGLSLATAAPRVLKGPRQMWGVGGLGSGFGASLAGRWWSGCGGSARCVGRGEPGLERGRVEFDDGLREALPLGGEARAEGVALRLGEGAAELVREQQVEDGELALVAPLLAALLAAFLAAFLTARFAELGVLLRAPGA